MIDHFVLFQLKEGVTEADVDALTDALYAVARFRDEAAFRAYLTHPQNLAVLADTAPRLFAGKHSVQLATSSA